MIEILWLNFVKKLNLFIKISGWLLEDPVIRLSNPDSPGVNNTPSSRKMSRENFGLKLILNRSELFLDNSRISFRTYKNYFKWINSINIQCELLFWINPIVRKRCYWFKSVSFQNHVYHGLKSICHRSSNILIGSCSIFLWINSIHAFDSIALFLSVTPIWNLWNTTTTISTTTRLLKKHHHMERSGFSQLRDTVKELVMELAVF